MIHTKNFDMNVAEVGGEKDTALGDGEFRAIVSVFDNVDAYGDVIRKGAFAKSLGDWAEKGDRIPVIWSHDWQDPFSHIGTVSKAEETDRGLEITGYIDPEERDANPKAAQIYRLLKSRRVTQFSFAFDIEDGGPTEYNGQDVYELRQLKVHEVGPCLLGVNQETELLAAKAAALTGRQDLGATARSQLVKAHELLGQILDVTPDDGGDTGQTTPPEPGGEGNADGSEDAANPTGGPASDPGTTTAEATRQRLDLEIALADSEDIEYIENEEG